MRTVRPYPACLPGWPPPDEALQPRGDASVQLLGTILASTLGGSAAIGGRWLQLSAWSVRRQAAVFSFQVASRTTGIFFLLFSAVLLLFAPIWVQHYIAVQDQWPVATDVFRLVAASDLMVGALLLAIASGQLPWRSQCWVSCGMATTTVILTGVHILLLVGTGDPPIWQPMLYFDTALFGLLSAYWVTVTVVSARRDPSVRVVA